MFIDPSNAVEMFHEFFHPLVGAYRGSMGLYQTKFSDEDKIDLGSKHRALFVQRKALAGIRRDPAVSGKCVPFEDDQLEGFQMQGEMDGKLVRVSLLLMKARVNRFGRIVTARNNTYRQIKRRQQQLQLFNVPTIPIIGFYLLRLPINPLNPQLASIGMGQEDSSGFEWMHTIWTDEGGMAGGIVHPQLPLIGGPSVRLRKPDEAQEIKKVGVRQSQKSREQDAKRSRNRSSRTGEGA